MARHSCRPFLWTIVGFLAVSFVPAFAVRAAETIWIEAEHLHGLRGSCFPDMGQTTHGAWAISGPGIAPEWTQGGESEWLSIACGPEDDQATATYDFEVPQAGPWKLWVRYRDWRGQSELFAVRIEQPQQPAVTRIFGAHPVVDEDDELKLLWQWAFGWDSWDLKLVKGPARLTLLAHARQPGHRQIDVFCLTTDPSYQPRHREKPTAAVWPLLEELRSKPQVSPRPLAARAGDFSVAPAWKPATFQDRGFLYLWNITKPCLDELASSNPRRVLYPYNTSAELLASFRETYGGRTDVPIFQDPRIVPTLHGAGPNILDDPSFLKWLDAHPRQPWANMMNYIGPVPLTPAARANWPRYRDRYVGNIAGENLGYFDYDARALNNALQATHGRAEVLDLLTRTYLASCAAKEKTIFGAAVADPYRDVIPCQSTEMMTYAHACREWGARTVGYESQTVVPSLAMRLAFLRGSARQYGGLALAYRSCNFGDAATIYSDTFLYAAPKYVYDNYYDVWAGAGMTWYKFDLWHQYLSGISLFYHEQGFDEFWMPGGNSTARKPLQLSPKGRLVDQFLQLTRTHPDRGVPFTPIAFLLDRAHGWDPNAYRPSYFGLDESVNPAVLSFDRHAQMLKEWFKVAYHPYGPREAALSTGVNPTYLPGVFGDIFDVLVTSPTRMDVLDSYPVVVLNGEVNLSAAWGKKLAAYVAQGGTLIAVEEQLSGPGVAELQLPERGAPAEDQSIHWQPDGRTVAAQRFRYRPIKGGQALATAANGDVLAALFERGKGRLVYLSIPRGLGIDGAATPLVALLLANTRQGLLPFEIDGEVEWLLNRTDKGWLVTLLNPAGASKTQHGVGPTDYAQQRAVTIRALGKVTAATEWFTGAPLPIRSKGRQTSIPIVVPAGGIRIIDIQ